MRLAAHARSFVRVLAGAAVVGLLLAPVPVAGDAKPRPQPLPQGIDAYLADYELLTLDAAQAAADVESAGMFTLETARGPFDVALAVHDMRSADYKAEAAMDGGEVRPLGRAASKTYSGYLVGQVGTDARFTVGSDRLGGMMLAAGEAFYLEPLGLYTLDAGPTDYVLYRGSDVRPDLFGTCAVTAAQKVAGALEKLPGTAEVDGLAGRVVQLATDADYEYVTAAGGPAAANAEILSVMNQVEAVYEREVGLTFEITYQHVWAAPNDPYTSTDPGTLLNELTNHWNANFGNIVRDLAHLWTGKDLTGSTTGIAWTGVVCLSLDHSYGLSQRLTTPTGNAILTAHEIGHNFSATHADEQPGCDNTIMESVVGTGLTFCQFSRDQITSWVESHPGCLAPAPAASGATVGVYNPANAAFFLRNSNTPGPADFSFGYGPPGAAPLVGDWDGNGTDTVGVYVPATRTFFLRNANSGGAASVVLAFGRSHLTPVAGDWNGDGVDTIGVYDPATSTFFLRNSNSPGVADLTFSFGRAGAGWRPVIGDWDGDGDDTVGLYSPATRTFFLKNAHGPGAADLAFSYGPPGATPVAGDWSNAGRDGVGVYVPATGVFFLRNSASPGPADTTVRFGPVGLVPVVGNWDGR
jgi:hypothetical protein